ncbi:hypothetical protein FI667_g8508, partial [Globisporangium splendens]
MSRDALTITLSASPPSKRSHLLTWRQCARKVPASERILRPVLFSSALLSTRGRSSASCSALLRSFASRWRHFETRDALSTSLFLSCTQARVKDMIPDTTKDILRHVNNEDALFIFPCSTPERNAEFLKPVMRATHGKRIRTAPVLPFLDDFSSEDARRSFELHDIEFSKTKKRKLSASF